MCCQQTKLHIGQIFNMIHFFLHICRNWQVRNPIDVKFEVCWGPFTEHVDAFRKTTCLPSS